MKQNKSVLICFISLIIISIHVDTQLGLYSVSLSGFGVEFLPRSLLVIVKAAGTEID